MFCIVVVSATYKLSPVAVIAKIMLSQLAPYTAGGKF
jgi:hypothetical protein